MALRIEDYAMIGDCETAAWSAATVRSIGCAGLALTRPRVSPHCLEQQTMAAGYLPQRLSRWK